jgi:gas vesicle protein
MFLALAIPWGPSAAQAQPATAPDGLSPAEPARATATAGNVPGDRVETSQTPRLLLDEHAVLPPDREQKIRSLLQSAAERHDLVYYVHIVDPAEYDQHYPQRAMALLEGDLRVSYGGVLVLSTQGDYLYHQATSLLRTLVGSDYVKNANATATRQAALVAVGAEQRIWTHVSALMENLVIALEGSRPESASSAAYIFDVVSNTSEEDQPADAEPAATEAAPAPQAPGENADGTLVGFLLGVVTLAVVGLVLRFLGKKRRKERSIRQGRSTAPDLATEAGSAPAIQPKASLRQSSATESEQVKEATDKLVDLLNQHKNQEDKATSPDTPESKQG